MNKPFCLYNLKMDLRSVAGNNCKKLFEKKENGIRFIFDRRSFNKMGCDKSINNSVINGFTVQEHFKAAENIKDYFECSEVIGQWNKKKENRTETHYLCICKISDGVYAYMPVVTWGKDEGYIDMYLSKDGE